MLQVIIINSICLSHLTLLYMPTSTGLYLTYSSLIILSLCLFSHINPLLPSITPTSLTLSSILSLMESTPLIKYSYLSSLLILPYSYSYSERIAFSMQLHFQLLIQVIRSNEVLTNINFNLELLISHL